MQATEPIQSIPSTEHPIENNVNPAYSHRFCVAPMLDWTDRHCRYFYRLLSKNALLYTEMVTTGALIHGERQRYLAYDNAEHPLALQLGGSNPEDLALCTRMAEDMGYDEVNLNIGCPSDRVQNGRFGACLMAEPALVADCVAAMRNQVSIPVTVKSRIGIDDQEDYADLYRFIDTVNQAGCCVFIIHARKAWLKGLSPKQNREIPPLRYDLVGEIKKAFPQLSIVLNGGIETLEAAQQHLQTFDGVMLGRSIYHNPYLLAQVDAMVFQQPSEIPERVAIIESLLPYIRQHIRQGGRLNHISRHILGLFQGQPGAKAWRRHISEHAHKSGATEQVITEALEFVSR